MKYVTESPFDTFFNRRAKVTIKKTDIIGTTENLGIGRPAVVFAGVFRPVSASSGRLLAGAQAAGFRLRSILTIHTRRPLIVGTCVKCPPQARQRPLAPAVRRSSRHLPGVPCLPSCGGRDSGFQRRLAPSFATSDPPHLLGT